MFSRTNITQRIYPITSEVQNRRRINTRKSTTPTAVFEYIKIANYFI
jgi:hypothetical protein